METIKYAAQRKHLAEHYGRLQMDIKKELLTEFREVCKANGTTPTTVIKDAVANYIKTHKTD